MCLGILSAVTKLRSTRWHRSRRRCHAYWIHRCLESFKIIIRRTHSWGGRWLLSYKLSGLYKKHYGGSKIRNNAMFGGHESWMIFTGRRLLFYVSHHHRTSFGCFYGARPEKANFLALLPISENKSFCFLGSKIQNQMALKRNGFCKYCSRTSLDVNLGHLACVKT